jgi:hypothetical protein
MPMRTTTSSRSVAALLALIAFGACSSSSPAKGTLTGTLHFSGGPVDAVGPAINGRVTATRTTDGKTFEIDVPTSGDFNLSVPPGNYQVSARSPLYQEGQKPCGTNDGLPITLAANQTVAVDVQCQRR